MAHEVIASLAYHNGWKVGVRKTMLNRIKSFAMTLLIALGLSVGFYQACLSKHEIKYWNEYCAYLNGEDLYTRHRVSTLSFDYDSIRDDFIHGFHAYIISNAKEQLGVRNPNFILSEAERLKMIGAWREGTQLHVANILVTSHVEPGGTLSFSEWVQHFKKFTDPAVLKDKGEMSDYEYCLFRSIDGLFDSVTLHGESETAKLELRHGVK